MFKSIFKESFKISSRSLFQRYSTRISVAENVETCEKQPEKKVDKPFDSIPGPKILPIIGSAWKYFPVIGNAYAVFKITCQETLYFLNLFRNIYFISTVEIFLQYVQRIRTNCANKHIRDRCNISFRS